MPNKSQGSGKRAKDAEMAHRMKEAGEKRTVGRCPICNGIIALDHLQTHIAHHPA